MGQKLIEEFLAKSGTEACDSFKDTGEAISKERIGRCRWMNSLGCLQDVPGH